MNTTGEDLGLSVYQNRKLAAVMDAACSILPKRYRPDSCIAATRILVDVLTELHVPVRPLAVTVHIFNQAFVERSDQEGRLPSGPDELNCWLTECGAWSIGLGELDPDSVPEPGRWNGHLAAVAWGHILVDLTVAQANRPAKNINLPALVVHLNEEELTGQKRKAIAINDCEVYYRARPENRSFLRAIDWQHPRRHDVATKILRKVREILREK